MDDQAKAFNGESGWASSTGAAEDLGTRADRRQADVSKVTRSHCKSTVYARRQTEKSLNARNRDALRLMWVGSGGGELLLLRSLFRDLFAHLSGAKSRRTFGVQLKIGIDIGEHRCIILLVHMDVR